MKPSEKIYASEPTINLEISEICVFVTDHKTNLSILKQNRHESELIFITLCPDKYLQTIDRIPVCFTYLMLSSDNLSELYSA